MALKARDLVWVQSLKDPRDLDDPDGPDELGDPVLTDIACVLIPGVSLVTHESRTEHGDENRSETWGYETTVDPRQVIITRLEDREGKRFRDLVQGGGFRDYTSISIDKNADWRIYLVSGRQSIYTL